MSLLMPKKTGWLFLGGQAPQAGACSPLRLRSSCSCAFVVSSIVACLTTSFPTRAIRRHRDNKKGCTSNEVATD